MVNRRTFLKRSSGTFPALFGTKVGAVSRHRQRQWTLPIEQVKERKAPIKSVGFTGDNEHTSVGQNEVSANSNGVTNFDLSAVFNGTGQFGMAGATTFGSTWEAPESGEYTLSAEYWGYGSYSPGIERSFLSDINTAGTGKVNLAIVDQTDTAVGKQTQVNLGSAASPKSEEAFETLVGFVAKQLIKVYFGLVGYLIASFLMHAFEPDLRLLRRNEFWIEPLEGRTVEVTFPARAGETYDIFFTPCTSFSVDSWGGPNRPYAPGIGAKYSLESLSIRRGDGNLS